MKAERDGLRNGHEDIRTYTVVGFRPSFEGSTSTSSKFIHG